jgi:hypothetical protein
MERLTLIVNGMAFYNHQGKPLIPFEILDTPYVRSVLNKLAQYEDLEEQGMLVRLPCKVGDTVFNTHWWDNKTEIVSVKGKDFSRNVVKFKVSKAKFTLYDVSDFGKTVFLTKSEAEQALKDGERE